jgi:hypothetical protein
MTSFKAQMTNEVQMAKRINHSLVGATFNREISKLKGEILAFEF